jgi:hypothetical protein
MENNLCKVCKGRDVRPVAATGCVSLFTFDDATYRGRRRTDFGLG